VLAEIKQEASLSVRCALPRLKSKTNHKDKMTTSTTTESKHSKHE
jgi:hypothetical protein